ncbi:MAG: hypothetical protein WD423_15545 [Rhodothermales bacterium]
MKEPRFRLQIPRKGSDSLRARIHWWTVTVLLVVMAVELVVTLIGAQWLNAFLILTIMGVTAAPALLRHRTTVDIPPEFQMLAIAFVFAALFLGEIRSYYEIYWWWDLALHASSGLLLGVLGFLLVYLLNESERVELHMRPRFVALFAVLFAMAVGVVWEIFEFGVDQMLGTQMQKPMLGDPSGLTDTMWDLILDTVGAAIVGFLGWMYMKAEKQSFFEAWIRKFIDRNPHLFDE